MLLVVVPRALLSHDRHFYRRKSKPCEGEKSSKQFSYTMPSNTQHHLHHRTKRALARPWAQDHSRHRSAGFMALSVGKCAPFFMMPERMSISWLFLEHCHANGSRCSLFLCLCPCLLLHLALTTFIQAHAVARHTHPHPHPIQPLHEFSSKFIHFYLFLSHSLSCLAVLPPFALFAVGRLNATLHPNPAHGSPTLHLSRACSHWFALWLSMPSWLARSLVLRASPPLPPYPPSPRLVPFLSPSSTQQAISKRVRTRSILHAGGKCASMYPFAEKPRSQFSLGWRSRCRDFSR